MHSPPLPPALDDAKRQLVAVEGEPRSAEIGSGFAGPVGEFGGTSRGTEPSESQRTIGDPRSPVSRLNALSETPPRLLITRRSRVRIPPPLLTKGPLRWAFLLRQELRAARHQRLAWPGRVACLRPAVNRSRATPRAGPACTRRAGRGEADPDRADRGERDQRRGSKPRAAWLQLNVRAPWRRSCARRRSGEGSRGHRSRW